VVKVVKEVLFDERDLIKKGIYRSMRKILRIQDKIFKKIFKKLQKNI